MRIGLFFAVVAICAHGLGAATAAKRTSLPAPSASGSAHGVGWIVFSKYKAKEIRHLSDLPPGIRALLQEHLIERLGERSYRRFSFFGGQVVDWPEFRRVEPDPGYKWKVFTYNLMFELRAPEIGIERYGASIQLDAVGGVIKVTGFPPVRRLPLKANLVPLSRAYALAKARGFDLSKTLAELSYDEEIESVTYRLSHRFRDNDWGGRERVIEVDAHSGRLLRARLERWYDHW